MFDQHLQRGDLGSFPYQGHMVQECCGGEQGGEAAVECNGSSLARLGSQTEQLKRWHQPVGAPRQEFRARWHMSETERRRCVFSDLEHAVQACINTHTVLTLIIYTYINDNTNAIHISALAM